MRKIKNYEITLIAEPNLTENEFKELLDKYINIIEKDGKYLEKDLRGRKKLAYEISGRKEGIYAVLFFQINPSHLQELERVLKIDERILRYLIVRSNKSREKQKFSSTTE